MVDHDETKCRMIELILCWGITDMLYVIAKAAEGILKHWRSCFQPKEDEMSR